MALHFDANEISSVCDAMDLMRINCDFKIIDCINSLKKMLISSKKRKKSKRKEKQKKRKERERKENRIRKKKKTKMKKVRRAHQ